MWNKYKTSIAVVNSRNSHLNSKLKESRNLSYVFSHVTESKSLLLHRTQVSIVQQGVPLSHGVPDLVFDSRLAYTRPLPLLTSIFLRAWSVRWYELLTGEDALGRHKLKCLLASSFSWTGLDASVDTFSWSSVFDFLLHSLKKKKKKRGRRRTRKR